MKTCPLKNGIPTYFKHIGYLKALGFSGRWATSQVRTSQVSSPNCRRELPAPQDGKVAHREREKERERERERERESHNTHTRMKRCQKALSYSQKALETGEPSIPTWNPTRTDLFSRNNSCFKQRVASVTDGSAAQPATQTGNLCS